jgi:hypothetical protein
MGKLRKSTDDSFKSAPSYSEITAANYANLAVSFIQARGGQGFVIVGPDGSSSARKDHPQTPAQWRAWIEYLEWKKVPTAFAKSHGLMTVPCEWPEDFDQTAFASDRAYRFPAAPVRVPMTDAGMRLRKEFVKAARAAYPGIFSEPPPPVAPQSADDRLAALAKRFAETAIPLSPALRALNETRSAQIAEAKREGD